MTRPVALDVDAAVAYGERHRQQAMVIALHDRVVFERYAAGSDAPHALYSGTKSFWGTLAVAARDDGVLDLDEPVASTFPGWREGQKAQVTLRMLLSLTSGIGFGGLGRTVPLYDAALAVALKDPPGTTFTYGGTPLQVFGAVLAAKLASRGLTPHAYLRERILDPIGLQVASWRALRDGTHPLPTGAFLTAHAWLRYGLLVRDGGVWEEKTIVRAASLAECFRPSVAHARYGLGWWLSPLAGHPDVVYASGSGGQALYVLPAAGAVVVRFGESASYKHEAFLTRLLSQGRAPEKMGGAPRMSRGAPRVR